MRNSGIRLLRIFASVAVWIPCVVLLFAAVGKLADLGAFEASLKTYSLLPSAVRTVAAVLIPTAEALPMVGIFLGRIRLAATIALLVFTAVTIIHTLHWWLGYDPHCNCFGVFLAQEHARTSRVELVARNMSLIFCSLLGFVVYSIEYAHRVPPPEPG